MKNNKDIIKAVEVVCYAKRKEFEYRLCDAKRSKHSSDKIMPRYTSVNKQHNETNVSHSL